MKIDFKITFLFFALSFCMPSAAFSQNETAPAIETTKDFKTLLTFYRGDHRKGGMNWQRHWNRRVPRDYTSSMGVKVKLAPRIDVRNLVEADGSFTCEVDYRMVVINDWDKTKTKWIYTIESTGTDEQEAVSNATQKHIVESDVVYHDFVDFFEHFIDSVFVKKCDDFLAASKTREADEKLAGALKWMEPITSNSPCFEEAEARRTDLKARISKKKCEDIIAKSTVAFEEEKYNEAMGALQKIDLKSVCEKDARTLCEQLLKAVKKADLEENKKYHESGLKKKFEITD